MGRSLRLLLACVLLSACAGRDSLPDNRIPLPPQSVVLRVEVTATRTTDWSPDCVHTSKPGYECIEFNFWRTYHARVIEVIAGKWAKPDVDFAYLMHASYIDEVTRDCYVILYPATQDFQSKIGVSLIADKLLSPFFKGQKKQINALRKSGT